METDLLKEAICLVTAYLIVAILFMPAIAFTNTWGVIIMQTGSLEMCYFKLCIFIRTFKMLIASLCSISDSRFFTQ
jgi:hypothetical protein